MILKWWNLKAGTPLYLISSCNKKPPPPPPPPPNKKCKKCGKSHFLIGGSFEFFITVDTGLKGVPLSGSIFGSRIACFQKEFASNWRGANQTSFRDVGDWRSAVTVVKTYEPTKRASIQTRRGEIDYGEQYLHVFVKSMF